MEDTCNAAHLLPSSLSKRGETAASFGAAGGAISMSAEENKAIVRRAFEAAFVKQDAAALDELLAPGCVIHQCGVLQPINRDRVKNGLSGQRALSDREQRLEAIVAEGDTVAVRWTLSGRHTSDLFRAATGKRVWFTVMTFARLEGGKVVEVWNNWDTATLLAQLDTPEEVAASVR
jgi:predicted ester cyclase